MNLNYLDGLWDMYYWNLRQICRPTTAFNKNDLTFNVQIQDATTSCPTRIVFNGPATIAFWPDGTKTVVKCQDDEPFDPEKGVALAMLKKYFGGSRYNDVLKKLINEAYACNESKQSNYRLH